MAACDGDLSALTHATRLAALSSSARPRAVAPGARTTWCTVAAAQGRPGGPLPPRQRRAAGAPERAAPTCRPRGCKQSAGLMVNYLYDLDRSKAPRPVRARRGGAQPGAVGTAVTPAITPQETNDDCSIPAAARRCRLLRRRGAGRARRRSRRRRRWPNKPVTIVVPFPPGGGTDAFARPLFAHDDQEHSGASSSSTTRAAPAARVGAGIAAKAAPDGYTFFMGAVHHAIAPSDVPQARLQHRDRLRPGRRWSRSVPQVIVVNPQRVQAKTCKSCSTTCARTRAS